MCEDLDEGKYSLPLIHALSCTEKAHTLHGLLSRRHIAGGLTGEQKRLVLRLMREAGSLEYTLTVLRTLFVELKAETSRLGAAFGQTNHELQLILEMLRV
jgi:ophiobolin F synthase